VAVVGFLGLKMDQAQLGILERACLDMYESRLVTTILSGCPNSPALGPWHMYLAHGSVASLDSLQLSLLSLSLLPLSPLSPHHHHLSLSLSADFVTLSHCSEFHSDQVTTQHAQEYLLAFESQPECIVK
jgi:hypothetical protein